jgi:ribose 5-phosphate isomerase B
MPNKGRTMKIAVGCDHGGFVRKSGIVDQLVKLGHKVVDVGCHSEESVDYPDFARKVGQAVASGQVDRGILICGTGIGMSIAANKVPGVRAAVCWDAKTAALASEHNNANVLCLSGRFLPAPTLRKMVKAWLTTPFAGGRHERRVGKMAELERLACAPKGKR